MVSACEVEAKRQRQSRIIIQIDENLRTIVDRDWTKWTHPRSLVGVNGPTRFCWVPMSIRHSPRPAIMVIPSSNTSSYGCGNLVWAPAIEGAFVLTTRGGDFELNIGQDVSIGYLSHTDSVVHLYLQDACVPVEVAFLSVTR